MTNNNKQQKNKQKNKQKNNNNKQQQTTTNHLIDKNRTNKDQNSNKIFALFKWSTWFTLATTRLKK